jgi:hypothetical protein
VNSYEVDASLRAVKATELALFAEGWAPRRVVILAEVIDTNGEDVFLGTGTENVTDIDVLDLMAQTLLAMVRERRS